MSKLLKLLLLTAIVILPFISQGQTVKMINSTQQSWYGGIAGRSGANYTFVVEFSDFANEPIPDTIWIGDEPIKLTVCDSAGKVNGNTKCKRSKKSIQFAIGVGTSHDEYADRYPIQGQEKKAIPPHPPITYKGVALLSYTYNGKRHFYMVSKIMTVYPAANYP